MQTDKIMEEVLAEQDDFTWCPQCHSVVRKEDFDVAAGMCNACISEAMAEAGEFFASRGLVPSAEEMEYHD